MGTEATPYAWDPHPLAWAIVGLGVVSVIVGHHRLAAASDVPIPWTRRQIGPFVGACLALVVAVTWPLANLAAHWSLTALVAQRALLMLVVAPLMLLGLPYDVIRWLSHPPAVDTVLTLVRRPLVAIITVTVLSVGSMTPALVRAQSDSVVARGLLDGGMMLVGLVLWIPVLGRIPGILRLTPVVRFCYLIAQAVAPAFLSFLYIFSRHPFYPSFARSHAAIGLQPLNDQQVAGFVSKLSMLSVLLTVGAVVLARAPTRDEELGTTDPLVWADVERQFERADRRGSRGVVAEADPVARSPQPSGSPSTTDRPGSLPSAADGDHRDHPSPSGEPNETDRPGDG